MVDHLLEPLDWSEIELLIEYGPGSGRFTFEMLRRMRADARLVAIETGAEFAKSLRSDCEDRRLIVVEGSARQVNQHLDRHGLCQADCIVTGLPFSTLEHDEGDVIMRETALALKSSGQLAAYQMRTAIKPLIERHFSDLREAYEWWNIPPCHLYWASSPTGMQNARARDTATEARNATPTPKPTKLGEAAR
jgi:phospholipid N-methyltransferase